MRDAGDQRDFAVAHPVARREREPGLLFEDVEDGLQRGDRALVDRDVALFDPADGRTERDAELAHLALGAQRDERLPERVVDDRFDARVVELQQVDVIGTEPGE